MTYGKKERNRQYKLKAVQELPCGKFFLLEMNGLMHKISLI